MNETSIKIKETEYNYLLPAMRKHLSYMPPQGHFFIGTEEDIADMRTRLVGLSW